MSIGSVNTPGGWLVEVKRKLSDLVSRMTSAERTISGLSGLSSTAVPNTRKINNKPLSSDITLSAGDVGALTQTQADDRYLQTSGGTMMGDLTVSAGKKIVIRLPSMSVGNYKAIFQGKSHYSVDENGTTTVDPSPYLYLDGVFSCGGLRMGRRKIEDVGSPSRDYDAANKAYVDGKAAEITPGSIGAAPANHTHTAAQVGAAPANHTHTAADVGAASIAYITIPKGRMRGDVDGDGIITKNDAEMIGRYAVGTETPDTVQRWCADTDGDGSVSMSDASLIARIAEGLEPNYFFTDYYNKWTYSSADKLWLIDVTVPGMTDYASTVVVVSGQWPQGTFVRAYANRESRLRIFSRHPPVTDAKAVVVFVSGREVDRKELLSYVPKFELDDGSVVQADEKGAAGGVATLDASGKVPASQLPAAATTAPVAAYVASSTAPTDKTKLWIDTTPTTGGLKYWNGSTWAHVPVTPV